MSSKFILLIFLSILHLGSSLNILSLLPTKGKSHMLAFLPMLRGLSEKGHNVTSVSYFPLSKPIPNYHDISLEKEASVLVEVVDLPSVNSDPIGKGVFTLGNLYFMGLDTCETFYKSDAAKFLQKYYKEGDFDVVLLEVFNTDCFLPLVKKFNAPIVALSSSTLLPWHETKFSSPLSTAYLGDFFLFPYNDLGFLGRVLSTVVHHIFHFSYNIFYHRRDDEIAKKYLDDPVSISELKYNFSLVLVNTHFSYSSVKPFVPQYVEIGGVHVTPPKKLPKELEKWVNESTNGVIYFSLGSMIKGHTLPDEKRQAFLRAFARFPQRVLWKWENESMPDKPDNVMIKKWMPQFDILAHPNVKAFISHGGLLGTIEAVHCGVPIIVMPQFGDQHTNAKALEKNGGGVILELADVTEETVYNALKTILDPNFKKQAEDLSARFKDRPLSPMDTAIYWIEYVARHKGAHHLKTAAVGMPLYQYYLLDVFAFLGVILLIHFYLTFVILRLLYRKLFGSKKQETKVKRQ